MGTAGRHDGGAAQGREKKQGDHEHRQHGEHPPRPRAGQGRRGSPGAAPDREGEGGGRSTSSTTRLRGKYRGCRAAKPSPEARLARARAAGVPSVAGGRGRAPGRGSPRAGAGGAGGVVAQPGEIVVDVVGVQPDVGAPAGGDRDRHQRSVHGGVAEGPRQDRREGAGYQGQRGPDSRLEPGRAGSQDPDGEEGEEEERALPHEGRDPQQRAGRDEAPGPGRFLRLRPPGQEREGRGEEGEVKRFGEEEPAESGEGQVQGRDPSGENAARAPADDGAHDAHPAHGPGAQEHLEPAERRGGGLAEDGAEGRDQGGVSGCPDAVVATLEAQTLAEQEVGALVTGRLGSCEGQGYSGPDHGGHQERQNQRAPQVTLLSVVLCAGGHRWGRRRSDVRGGLRLRRACR